MGKGRRLLVHGTKVQLGLPRDPQFRRSLHDIIIKQLTLFTEFREHFVIGICEFIVSILTILTTYGQVCSGITRCKTSQLKRTKKDTVKPCTTI